MTGSTPLLEAEPRCLCICAQQTPGDARMLLEAMGKTQAGMPDASDLALAMVRTRRIDLLDLIHEHYTGFSLENEMKRQGQDTLVALTRALSVEVGNGEFRRLDPKREAALGKQIVTSGLLPVEALLDLDAAAANRTGVGPPPSESRWIFGRPLNPGLAMGLFQGVLETGVDTTDKRWNRLLDLVIHKALDRFNSTHLRQNPALDALVEFILDRIEPNGEDSPSPQARCLIVNLHALRNLDGQRWPLARAACNRMVSNEAFCRMVALTSLQVRAWSRLVDTSDIMDPEIFKRAGSTPDAMGALGAFVAMNTDKNLLENTQEQLKHLDWNEDERFIWTLSLAKEMEWMLKFSQTLPEIAPDPGRLAQVLGCIHGAGRSVDDMTGAIFERLDTGVEEREDIQQFRQKLLATLSMIHMDANTRSAGSARIPGRRL